jgi:hypothetical protein
MRIRIKKFGDYYRPQYKKWFRWHNYYHLTLPVEFEEFYQAKEFAMKEAREQYRVCEMNSFVYVECPYGNKFCHTLDQAKIMAKGLVETHVEHEPIYHPYE